MVYEKYIRSLNLHQMNEINLSSHNTFRFYFIRESYFFLQCESLIDKGLESEFFSSFCFTRKKFTKKTMFISHDKVCR